MEGFKLKVDSLDKEEDKLSHLGAERDISFILPNGASLNQKVCSLKVIGNYFLNCGCSFFLLVVPPRADNRLSKGLRL